jgi:hypothetical protein
VRRRLQLDMVGVGPADACNAWCIAMFVLAKSSRTWCYDACVIRAWIGAHAWDVRGGG